MTERSPAPLGRTKCGKSTFGEMTERNPDSPDVGIKGGKSTFGEMTERNPDSPDVGIKGGKSTFGEGTWTLRGPGIDCEIRRLGRKFAS